jgi:fructosamine-3-kinase
MPLLCASDGGGASRCALPCRPPRCVPAARRRTRRGARPAAPRAAAAAPDDEVADWISTHTHAGAGAVRARVNLGGSDWASCARYDTDSGRSFFAKTSARGADMFAGEAAGLRALAHAAALRVPAVLHTGALTRGDGGSCIIMTHLDLRGSTDQALLGRQLARMHAVRHVMLPLLLLLCVRVLCVCAAVSTLACAQARRKVSHALIPPCACGFPLRAAQAPPLAPEAASGRFGFPVDNTIGGTPQRNSWSEGVGTSGWVDFYRERRLRPQLALSREPSLQRAGEVLCERLPALFESVRENITPSILHGDLWSGNVACDGADGAPVVFDPAAYYGACVHARCCGAHAWRVGASVRADMRWMFIFFAPHCAASHRDASIASVTAGHSEAEFGMSWCASFSPAFWAAYHEIIPRVRTKTHTQLPVMHASDS